MAKSTNGTKKLNEALTPDQVSKVEDKYKSIYSGMLKGNKKKLMKYIDPKLKRPNPDAMAMGRAINLVKKETETETVNEGTEFNTNSFKKGDTVELLGDTWEVIETNYKPGKKYKNPFVFKGKDMKYLPVEIPTTNSTAVGYKVKTQGSFPMVGFMYQHDGFTKLATVDVVEDAIETIEKVKFGPKRKEAMAIVLDAAYKKTGEKARTYKQALQFLDLEEPINETLKLGVKYQLPTGETGYIMTGGSDDPRDWKFSGNKQPYLSVEDKLTPLEKQPGKYDGAFDMGLGKGHHIDEELVNEENSYDSFKTDASERFLNRSQVVELLPALKNSLNKLNFSPSKQPALSVKRYGLSSSNKGYVISMYIPTSKDDIIVELGKYPKDDKTDEVSISLYLPNEEGRLTQVAYETSTSPKGEELAEDSNVLSKVISMANQWYDFMCAMTKPGVKRPKGLSKSEAEEMCKDTAISKKKLKETTMNNDNPPLDKLEKKVKSILKKEGGAVGLKPLVDAAKELGASKKDLMDVLKKMKDVKTHKDGDIIDTSGLNENGMNKAKKNMDMYKNQNRLTELIKAALTGPVKEGGGIDDEGFKDEDREERLKKREEEEMEKSTKSSTKGFDDEAMMESSTLKEGIWSMGTVTQIQNFLRDLNRLKDKYYNIVGSDDVFDGLDRAERSAEEMAYDAGRSIEEITELATTPIKDDIYVIGSRIYKDPYEAISLVATDQTVVVRDFARKDKKFKAAVMDYVKSKGLETSVDRDGLYIDTKPLDFKGMPLMNETSTDKYDDNPGLKGKQSELPDALQKGILGLEEDNIDEDVVKGSNIKKVGDDWRVLSGKTGKMWKQKYNSKKDAEAALRGYFASQNESLAESIFKKLRG
mgnify:CR=1 FL=1